MISFFYKAISQKPLFRYLFRLSIFSLFLLSLVAILGYMADKGLKESEYYFYKRWSLLNKPIEADLLIVGNSRAGWQIDPFVMDSLLNLNSYNLGLEGGPFDYSEAVWRTYRYCNKRNPKLVVCNVDFVCFNDIEFENIEERWIPFYGDTSFNCIEAMKNLSLVDLYIPGMKYYKATRLLKTGLAIYWGGTKKKKLPDNQIWRKGAMLFNSQTMRKTALAPNTRKFKPSTKRIEMFCLFLDECRANTIAVVLMKAPIHPIIYPELTGLEESFTLIDSLSKTKELPLLDYTNYLIEDTTCFIDPAHLNYKGAKMLSVKLANDIDSLVIQSKIKL